MALFAAMRAEHTVSESTEESFISLNPISSSYIKETSKDLSHNILYDPDNHHTCFNRFLLHYQLPLLAHSQTIQTLIQHIDENNNNKTVSSITFFVNLSYDEIHIYLPNNTLLPDHIVIAPHLFPIFYNLPLRSNFINPTSIPSDLFFDNYSS